MASDRLRWTVVVVGGKRQEGDEGPVIDTEIDSVGVGRKVSRGTRGGSDRD